MLVGENQVTVEKTFRVPASDVFRALSVGRLFFNCSGDYENFENDFRVGGRYRVYFKGASAVNSGQYLEIVNDRKIVFTWGDVGSDEGFPKTKVTVDLFSEGTSTKLVVVHTGFEDRESAEAHDGGWNSGLSDLASEMEKGEIRMVRDFEVPRARLYAACSDPKTFFGLVSEVSKGTCDFRVGGKFLFPTEKGGAIEGTFEKIVPDEELVFTWMRACEAPIPGGSRVTLQFEDGDESGSCLTLVHSGLANEKLVEMHREGWSYLTNRLMK